VRRHREQRVAQVVARGVGDLAVEHGLRGERVARVVVGVAGRLGPPGRGRHLPPEAAVGSQHVDHADLDDREVVAEPGPHPRRHRRVGGVDDERHPPDPVREARVSQGRAQHGQVVVEVAGWWQVDPGMEGAPGIEREHHDGVARPEAEHDGDGGEEVFGAAGGQRGGHVPTLPPAAGPPEGSGAQLWTRWQPTRPVDARRAVRARCRGGVGGRR
jgi:hypothetical protein